MFTRCQGEGLWLIVRVCDKIRGNGEIAIWGSRFQFLSMAFRDAIYGIQNIVTDTDYRIHNNVVIGIAVGACQSCDSVR